MSLLHNCWISIVETFYKWHFYALMPLLNHHLLWHFACYDIIDDLTLLVYGHNWCVLWLNVNLGIMHVLALWLFWYYGSIWHYASFRLMHAFSILTLCIFLHQACFAIMHALPLWMLCHYACFTIEYALALSMLYH